MDLLSGFIDKVRERMEAKVEERMQRALAAGIEVARKVVHVDTGQTRDSIAGYYDQATRTAVLSASTNWAAHLEARYPFIRPGLAAMAEVWGGKIQGQFDTLPGRYHESAAAKIDDHRIVIGRRVGHGGARRPAGKAANMRRRARKR
jgi:hypothetical protein